MSLAPFLKFPPGYVRLGFVRSCRRRRCCRAAGFRVCDRPGAAPVSSQRPGLPLPIGRHALTPELRSTYLTRPDGTPRVRGASLRTRLVITAQVDPPILSTPPVAGGLLHLRMRSLCRVEEGLLLRVGGRPTGG